MGYFGTGLSDNDIYLDIYGEFFTLYNKGLEVEEISKDLIESNQECINDTSLSSPDAFCFWYALANAQWECKNLHPNVYQKVKHIIDNDYDLIFWEGDDKAKRKNSLLKFLEKISSERSKAKPRKKTKPPLFKKGDCLVVKLPNGNYSGVVILEALFNKEDETSSNLAAATRINTPIKPVLDDFINAEVLITNFEFDNDKQAFQQIHWIYQYQHKKVKDLIEVIGNIEVIYNFTPSKCYGGFGCPSGPFFEDIVKMVLTQYKSEESKPKYKYTKTIKELTQSETWRFW
jgi:hypothetical protein